MFAQFLYPSYFFCWRLCTRLLSSLLTCPTFIIPLPSPLFILEMWTLCGFTPLLLLKGDPSLTATHHILTHSHLCRCVFLLAANSPLLWGSCSNDTCIPSCIHTLYPHFWDEFPILSRSCWWRYRFSNFLYVLTICQATHWWKSMHTPEVWVSVLSFLLLLHELDGIWPSCCSATLTSRSLHTNSQAYFYFSGWLLKSFLVISWLLFNQDEGHLKQIQTFLFSF